MFEKSLMPKFEMATKDEWEQFESEIKQIAPEISKLAKNISEERFKAIWEDENGFQASFHSGLMVPQGKVVYDAGNIKSFLESIEMNADKFLSNMPVKDKKIMADAINGLLSLKKILENEIGTTEKQNEGKENKIKTDYDIRIESQTVEHKSQEWEKIDVDLQNGIKEIVGDEFTVKFISITRVMDEAGIFDAAGSIELTDKEEKKRLFHVEHHYKHEENKWHWTIEEKDNK